MLWTELRTLGVQRQEPSWCVGQAQAVAELQVCMAGLAMAARCVCLQAPLTGRMEEVSSQTTSLVQRRLVAMAAHPIISLTTLMWHSSLVTGLAQACPSHSTGCCCQPYTCHLAARTLLRCTTGLCTIACSVYRQAPACRHSSWNCGVADS